MTDKLDKYCINCKHLKMENEFEKELPRNIKTYISFYCRLPRHKCYMSNLDACDDWKKRNKAEWWCK